MIEFGVTVAEIVQIVVLGGGVGQVDRGIEQAGGLLVGFGQDAAGGVEDAALTAVVEALFVADVVAVEGLDAVFHGAGAHIDEVIVFVGGHVGGAHADHLGTVQGQGAGRFGELAVIAD